MSEEFVPNKRQSAILKLLAKDGFVAIDEMVSRFDVTPQTIRRDLNTLDSHQLITRFHGGAGIAKNSGNRPYKDRLATRVEAKNKIAKTVKAIIPDGASLFLNNGTTIEAVARELLSHHGLSVVTNNLNVAHILRENETFDINIVGGRVRHVDGAITGLTSIEFMEQFHMDFGIVGTNSMDDEGALWDYDELEVRISKAIIKNSRHSILVADEQKFGRKARNRMGHISDFDTLVTDTTPAQAYQNLFRAADMDIQIAE